jgi:large subunit ribosomal protein L21e
MGDRVRIMINPAVQKGMPHRRYQGSIGTVTEKRGRSYVLHVGAVNGSIRTIISRPEHILPMVEAS